MAEEVCNVRVEERLKIKIGEAKNLQCRSHGSTPQRDVYCTVSLDQEEIFRTRTIEKTLSPFFGEEYRFEVPRRFRYLSVYVYDRDKHLRPDRVVGKVAIKREELGRYHDKDHWFAIRPVDADSEVQGEANVAVGYGPDPSRVSVTLVECVDLPLKNGACDPYAVVTVTYSNGKRHSKRTKVKKKTTRPRFDETLLFDATDGGDGDLCEACVALWHDVGMGGDDLFLGEVRIPSRRNRQTAATDAWYFLQPRRSGERGGLGKKASCSTPPGTRLSCDNSLGSLRLQVHYVIDHVFPSESYEPLRALLLESVDVQPITSSAVYILGEIVSSKTDAAQPLVRVFMHHGRIVPLVRALANSEISKLTDPTTIFRGNTLVSKMMDETMKLAGLHYLHTTLRPSMDAVFVEKKPCEIDPTRVKDPAAVETNLSNLIDYVGRVFDAIVRSAVDCPPLMRRIFHDLKECATSYFPDNAEVRYSVVSGFIFLRFFAPAILGPRLFDLTREQIDSQTNRTLTLISKTIQSLGNLVSSRSAQLSCKEEYMERVHQAFRTDAHIRALRQFLEIVSSSSSPERSSVDTPVLLKEGIMIKRAQGRKRFGRKNFKRRYFRLTTHDLSYSKTKGREPLCRIPLADVLAVERLNEDSFKMKNMFQVVQRERALYVQASNCVERKEWVDLLTKLCSTNDDRLRRYHPCAFVDGRWPCCRSSNELAEGCERTTSLETDNPHVSFDPERDLERIRSLLVAHASRLDTLAKMCECRAAYTGDVRSLPGCVDDVRTCFKTIRRLQDVAYTLEREHRTYLRALARETKYGSKQAPIGDDNYLRLAARLSFDSTSTRRVVDA